ncbi:MAG TPA: hypothetical protein VN924_33085 [Bryobacteraceae bacterium]|nr:hypothetical protein [Bryobacteraceae bacterium]
MPIQAAEITEELLDALAARLISRLMSGIDGPWCVEYCKNESAAAA